MKHGLLPAVLMLTPLYSVLPLQAQTAAMDSRHIAYTDLDLRSASGRRQLDLRIAMAQQALCGTPSTTDLADMNRARRCLHDTAQVAMAQRQRAILRALE